MCLITGHEERDQTFMGDYPYEDGCLYLFDRAYMKTPGLAAVARAGAFFVVRKKKDILYRTVGESVRSGTYSDSPIKFTGRWASSGYPWRQPVRFCQPRERFPDRKGVAQGLGGQVRPCRRTHRTDAAALPILQLSFC